MFNKSKIIPKFFDDSNFRLLYSKPEENFYRYNNMAVYNMPNSQIDDDVEIYKYETAIIRFILKYTDEKKCSSKTFEMLDELVKSKIIEDYDFYKKDLYLYDVFGNVTIISLLSKCLNLSKTYSNINNRQGHCHSGSWFLMPIVKNFKNVKMVTGQIYAFTSKSKFLHTWIEFDNKLGERKVIDFTLNLIIDKTSYYRLHHIDYTQLNSIDYNEYTRIKDTAEFLLRNKMISIKQILTFHEQIFKDLEKNNMLL